LGERLKDVRTVVISQDPPDKNKGVVAKQKLSFPIYADPDLEAAKAFGLVFQVDDTTRERYKQYGIDLVALYGRDTPLMPTPAVFILNAEGKVAFSYVNPDYRVRLAPEVIKAVLDHGL